LAWSNRPSGHDGGDYGICRIKRPDLCQGLELVELGERQAALLPRLASFLQSGVVELPLELAQPIKRGILSLRWGELEAVG
jgi:hypothetical protein